MPKLKKTIKAEQEQAYMSRVAQLILRNCAAQGTTEKRLANSLALTLLPVQLEKTKSRRTCGLKKS